MLIIDEIPRGLARCTYHYIPTIEDGLELSPGDIVVLLRSEPFMKWWIGIKDDKIGYFPREAVEVYITPQMSYHIKTCTSTF